jgi:hypothetical protein
MPVASGSIAFLGAARFQGYWNASTNTGTGSIYGGITGEKLGLFETGSSPNAGYDSGTNLTASKGDYWQVTSSGAHSVDGDTNWGLNDFCIFSGSELGAGTWKRLSYEDTVASIVLGDMSTTSFHMGAANDGHVIFAKGTVFSGSSDFVYDYLTSKISVTTVSGTTMTPHTVNLGQGGLAGPAATVSASAGTFAVLSGSTVTAHELHGDGSRLQNVTGTITAVASGANNRVATFGSADTLWGEIALQFDGSTLTLAGVMTGSSYAGYNITTTEAIATTVSGTTMTPHTVNLGQGGLAGPAATVSASAGTFAVLSGSAISGHTLTVASFSPISVSASSGQFATLSGSTVTAYNVIAAAVSGTTMTPHTVNLGQGGLAGPAATVSASAGTFATLSGSAVTAYNVIAAAVSGTTMTPHTVNLGQGGLAGPAATVSASAGTFAVLSGSAVTLNKLTLSSVSGSRAGPGSYLAVSSAGLVVLEEAGGTITAVTSGANNRVATFGSADTLTGEMGLQFDGSSLIVQGAVTANIVSNAAAPTSDTTVTTGYNSLMLGPITINTGRALTIQAGAVLKIKDIAYI